MSQQSLGEPSGIEQELKSAIGLYSDQIAQLLLVIASDPENQSEAAELRDQLQEALDEARAALRAQQRHGADSAGRYAKTASAAACMDTGDDEEGQEAESKQSGLNVGGTHSSGVCMAAVRAAQPMRGHGQTRPMGGLHDLSSMH